MPRPHELENLIKWSGREEWSELLNDVFDRHFGVVEQAFDIDFDRIEALIGNRLAMNLWGCAFEDFLTRLHPDSERTIVDDYLKRRGWKEGASSKRYMKALSDSAISLYEVVEVDSGKSMLVRDFVFDHPPVRVVEHSATKHLKPGDWVALRVVDMGADLRIGGGMLRFDPVEHAPFAAALAGQVDEVRQALARVAATALEEGAAAPTEQERDLVLQVSRIGLAPAYSAAWLRSALSKHMEMPPPPTFNSDGDPLELYTLDYPFGVGVSAPKVGAKLLTMPNLCPEADEIGVWNWIETDGAAEQREIGSQAVFRDGAKLLVELEDGTSVLGTVELDDEGLIVTANSRRRADLAKVMIKSALGSLVGRPEETVEPMYDEVAEPEERADGVARATAPARPAGR